MSNPFKKANRGVNEALDFLAFVATRKEGIETPPFIRFVVKAGIGYFVLVKTPMLITHLLDVWEPYLNMGTLGVIILIVCSIPFVQLGYDSLFGKHS